jgi:hypothetical protein
MKALDAESAQLAGRMTSNGPMVLFLIPLPFALNFKRQPSAVQKLMEAFWIAVISAGLMTFVGLPGSELIGTLAFGHVGSGTLGEALLIDDGPPLGARGIHRYPNGYSVQLR